MEGGATESAAEERWAALESNPEVLTNFCHQMGVTQAFQVVDVWGLDEDILGFVPQPAIAMVLLFPSKNPDGSRAREKLDVEVSGESDQIYFLKQIEGHLDNACGTIAMIHAILNNRSLLGIEGKDTATLENFYNETKDMSPEDRGKHLDTYQPIATVHNSLLDAGQSSRVEADKVCHHFVCVTAVGDSLVELDGAYNSGPNVVGKLEGQTLLMAAAKFIKAKYINENPDGRFSLMALVMGGLD